MNLDLLDQPTVASAAPPWVGNALRAVELQEYDGWARVNVDLSDRSVVYRSDRNNYVCVRAEDGVWAMDDGTRVTLVAINGEGEVRWAALHHGRGLLEFDPETLAAIEYFRLTAVMSSETREEAIIELRHTARRTVEPRPGKELTRSIAALRR